MPEHEQREQDEQSKPTPKHLAARARGKALIDLSRMYPIPFRRLYLVRKREEFEAAGLPLSRRQIRHRDAGNGFCQACGQVFPCHVAQRRIARNA